MNPICTLFELAYIQLKNVEWRRTSLYYISISQQIPSHQKPIIKTMLNVIWYAFDKTKNIHHMPDDMLTKSRKVLNTIRGEFHDYYTYCQTV